MPNPRDPHLMARPTEHTRRQLIPRDKQASQFRTVYPLHVRALCSKDLHLLHRGGARRLGTHSSSSVCRRACSSSISCCRACSSSLALSRLARSSSFSRRRSARSSSSSLRRFILAVPSATDRAPPSLIYSRRCSLFLFRRWFFPTEAACFRRRVARHYAWPFDIL